MKYLTTLTFLFFSTAFVLAQKATEKVVTINVIEDYFLQKKATGILTDKHRIVVPIELPDKTLKWFYTISAYRNKEDIQRAKQNIKLFAQLTRVLDQTGTTANAISMIAKPPGGDFCNLYVMSSYSDGQKFKQSLGGYDYDKIHSVQSAVSGIQEVPGSKSRDMYFLGIENPSLTADLHINIQVSAVIIEEPEINGWTKSQKEGLYSNISFGVKEKHKHHLTEDLILDLSNCMISKFTSQYSANQLENTPKYEIKGIFETIHNQCEQELNLTAKYALKDEVATEERLIGTWSDENSVFEFKGNGVFNLKFDNQNTIIEGKWKIKDDWLTFTINGKEDLYIIEEYSENKIRYRFRDSGQKFNAERISREGYNKSIVSAGSTNGSANFADLVGKWKADNCTYTLSNDGSILISWFSGGTTAGIWRFENSQLKVKYAKTDSWSIYEFKKFSKTDMEYQHIQTKEVFKATKVR
jgi:hypothetical protein